VHDDAQVWVADVEQRALGLLQELEDLRRWWPVRISRSIERRTRPFRVTLRRLAGRPLPERPASPHAPVVAAAAARARALAAEGQVEAAEELLLEARRAHPGAMELLVAHAECAMSAGDLSAAEARWRRLMRVFGPLVPDEAVARLAFTLRMQGRPEGAVEVIRAARHPRTAAGVAVVRFELGAALAEDGRFAEALEVFVALAEAEELPDPLRLATDSLVLSIARRGALRVPEEFLPERRTPADHGARRWPIAAGDIATHVGASLAGPAQVTFLVDATGAAAEEVRTTVASIGAQVHNGAVYDCIVVTAPSMQLEPLLVGEAPVLVVERAAESAEPPLEVGRGRASGRMIVPVSPGDRVASTALEHLIQAYAGGSTALIYADEDLVHADGQGWGPALKPAWDPDLLMVNPYLGAFVAFDASALARIGGFRRVPALEPPSTPTGTVAWEAALRLWFAGELGQRGERVARVTKTLVHRRPPWSPRTSDQADLAPTFLPRPLTTHLVDHMNRDVLPAGIRLELWGAARTPRIVRALPQPLPTVSVIVPTRDRRDLLELCFEALNTTAGDVPLELIVVDNGSGEPETLDFLTDLEAGGMATIVRSPGVFNFSQLVNRGAAVATGEVLLLLNNDVVALDRGWLEEMLQHALRDEVGAVGALLLHEDGRIQHAGVIVGGNGFAEHAFREWSADAPGYLSLLHSQRRVSAVTAACLMVRRKVFLAVAGFDEQDLPVDLNDIDFCLRLRAQGFEIMWTPFARLLHVEGATRSVGVDQERSAATRVQQQAFLRRWSVNGVLPEDPTYHPGLSLVGPTYCLAPER
jgi:GT2 family glycosyltransferase